MVLIDKDYMEYIKTVIRGRKEPEWWVKNVLGVELFPKQEEILKEFYLGGYKELDLLAGMRGGKSVLSSIIGVYEYWLLDTLENPAKEYGLIKNQPLFVMCIAPSSEQAKDTLFTNMSGFVESSEWFSTWSDTKVKTEEVVNDKKHIGIKILSSQASTGVGRTNKCVIFDEIASFEDTTSKRGAWEVYSRIRKSTQTLGRNGHVVAISSAQRPNDIMVTLWRQGLERDDILSLKIPTWEMNPNYSKEDLMNEYRDDYGSFLRDFACEPSGNTAIAFPNGVNLNKSIVNKLKTWTEPDGRMRVCAIDPALKNDGFGIAIGYKDGNDFVIDGATRFIKKTGEPYVKPSEIKEFLERVVNTYGITHLIHDTWMFPEIIEMMESKYGVTCIKHIVGFEDYKRWWEMQDGKLEGTLNITYDRVLEREASNVFVKDGKRPTVDHPSNGTKDIADCVCNILWLLTNDEYYGITGKQPIYFYNVF